MQADIGNVLITRARIADRVRELGQQIAADLAGVGEDEEIVLVPILTGSIIFVADLMRELPHKIRISLAMVSSYPGASVASTGAKLIGNLPEDLTNRHVLIVDDILDSGQTIRLIRAQIMARKPRSLRVCVLLRKETPAAMAVPCDYVGFDIPDEFVVGYGLDYDNFYRNLPEIGTLKKEAMSNDE